MTESLIQSKTSRLRNVVYFACRVIQKVSDKSCLQMSDRLFGLANNMFYFRSQIKIFFFFFLKSLISLLISSIIHIYCTFIPPPACHQISSLISPSTYWIVLSVSQIYELALEIQHLQPPPVSRRSTLVSGSFMARGSAVETWPLNSLANNKPRLTVYCSRLCSMLA